MDLQTTKHMLLFVTLSTIKTTMKFLVTITVLALCVSASFCYTSMYFC